MPNPETHSGFPGDASRSRRATHSPRSRQDKSANNPNSRPEVVVTGLGVLCPLGVGYDALWTGFCDRRSGVRSISLFDGTGLPMTFGAEVPDFLPAQFIKPRKALKVMARDIQLGVSAAEMACRDAGVSPETVDPTRLGTIFGANLLQNPLEELQPLYRSCLVGGKFVFDRWANNASMHVFPLFMLKYLPNMTACHVGIMQQALGPNNTVTMDAAASLLAVMEAVRTIQSGRADVMIAGGASTRMYALRYIQSERGQPQSHRNSCPRGASRPFDRDRDGFVNGEGAAAFILERREHALARGAKPLARFVGGSSRFSTTVSGNTRGPERRKEGYSLAIRAALADAGLDPPDIGHVNADGWSTQENDRAEAQAIAQELGDVPVFAAKSYFGYLGAGSGAVELAASLMAFRHGTVPVTLNYDTPDPQCPVHVIHREPLSGNAAGTALCLNQSPAGQTAAVVMAAP